MKKIFKEKADKLLQVYHNKYIRTYGVSIDDTKNYDHFEHLINLAKLPVVSLGTHELEIVKAYYATNNDNYFDSLFSKFMLELAKKAEETMGSTSQRERLHNGLYLIVKRIAFDSFIKLGIEGVLKEEEFKHI